MAIYLTTAAVLPPFGAIGAALIAPYNIFASELLKYFFDRVIATQKKYVYIVEGKFLVRKVCGHG